MDWVQKVKAAYTAHTGRRAPPFPTRGMIVSGNTDHATIMLAPVAVAGHMSTNASAFEGWSLALRRWGNAQTVTIDWPPLSRADVTGSERKHRLHYQRFLYRVDRFVSLFDDWFRVANAGLLFDSEIISGTGPFYLNRQGDTEHPLGKGSPEDTLERSLLNDSTLLRRHLSISDAATPDRQIPVGLFSTPTPTEKSRIFPNGYIDFACVDRTTLWVFELKAGSNNPVGTLSELLFYTSIMRDVVEKRFHIEGNAGARARIRPEMLAHIREINGVMMGHSLPPFVAESEVFRMLNDAVDARWNKTSNGTKVSFRADQITGDDPYTFQLIA